MSDADEPDAPPRPRDGVAPARRRDHAHGSILGRVDRPHPRHRPRPPRLGLARRRPSRRCRRCRRPTPSGGSRGRGGGRRRTCRRCSASRSRSRTSWSPRAGPRPPAAASSRASSARTTPTSRSAWTRPAPSSRARRTWTSSPWARRPSTRPGARPPTPGISSACLAAPAAVRRQRSPRTTSRSASAPTRAAPSASRRPCAASSA